MKYILPRLQLILLVLPALLLAGSCNKEKTQQPGEGEHFVKFKVNGQQKYLAGAAKAKNKLLRMENIFLALPEIKILPVV